MTIAIATPKPHHETPTGIDAWIARPKPNAPGHLPAPPNPTHPKRPHIHESPPSTRISGPRFGAPLLRHDATTTGSLWQRLRRRTADHSFDIQVHDRLDRFIAAPPANLNT